MPLVLMNLPMGLSLRTALSLGSMLVSVIALLVFLKQVKTAQTYTYLPLGPALVLGILIALFWGQPLLAGYESLLKG
jgi:prepilin signal peptidase PulO-like enzyme (type II secretory pathway)